MLLQCTAMCHHSAVLANHLTTCRPAANALRFPTMGNQKSLPRGVARRGKEKASGKGKKKDVESKQSDEATEEAPPAAAAGAEPVAEGEEEEDVRIEAELRKDKDAGGEAIRDLSIDDFELLKVRARWLMKELAARQATSLPPDPGTATLASCLLPRLYLSGFCGNMR